MSTFTETVAARHLRRAALAQRRWSSVTFYAGLGILGVLLLVGLLAPVVAPHDPNALDLLHRLAPPSWAHPMGTDTFGRDILSRVLHALRLDLQVTFII